MQMPIRSLQSMLRLLQRHAGKPTTVVPDGIFGPETARAVREFQQQNGLPVTGAADLTTWNAVVDAAREAHPPWPGRAAATAFSAGANHLPRRAEHAPVPCSGHAAGPAALL